MQVFHFVVGYVVLSTLAPVLLHNNLHGHFNIYQILLAFFCSLNILISCWEISLGLQITFIKKEYLRLKDKV